MRLYAYATAAVLALSTSAWAQDVTVSDIRVNADLTAVTSPAAATYWGGIEADLSSALAAEFSGLTAPEGFIVAVDLDEISLANFFSPAATLDDARLSGDVGLFAADAEEGDDAERFFTVTATANQAATYLPAGSDTVVLAPTSNEYYVAVVRAFARGVADTVRAGE